MKSIVLLAAHPEGAKSLRLHQEEREIKQILKMAGYGKVPIKSFGAICPGDIQQALLDFEPQIVHFSGHGAGQDGLVFEDGNGQAKLVSAEALAGLFKIFSNRIECVVLNACYTELQAEAIAQHIDYVIGMSQSIGDRAAIAFSGGFYRAIGSEKSIELAYELGCNAIHLEGMLEYSTPVLIRRNSTILKKQADQLKLRNGYMGSDIEENRNSNEVVIQPSQMRKRFFKISIIGGIGMIIIAIVIFLKYNNLASQFIPSSLNTPSSLQVYQSPKHNLEVTYPITWIRQDIVDPFDGSIVKFVPQTNQEFDEPATEIIITVQDYSKQPSTLQEYVDFIISMIKTHFPNAKIISRQSATLANSPAYKIVYSGTENGKYVKLMQVGTLKNYKVYAITYKSSLNEYQNHEGYAEEIVHSLKIKQQ